MGRSGDHTFLGRWRFGEVSVIQARTEVVGSLLRPRELLQARERLERGEIAPPEFKQVEDAAVDAAIRLQEGVGLAVVTDGEMRRLSFQSQLTEAVEGFSDWNLDAFVWGDWHGDEVGGACHYNCVSRGWTKMGRCDHHSAGKGTIRESGHQC